MKCCLEGVFQNIGSSLLGLVLDWPWQESGKVAKKGKKVKKKNKSGAKEKEEKKVKKNNKSGSKEPRVMHELEVNFIKVQMVSI